MLPTALPSIRLLALPLALSAALLLPACGGGGGSSTGSATPTDNTSGTSANTFASAPVLTGVVAAGAPLGGATVSVIDATGAAMGSTTTRSADGAYTLTLGSKAVVGPLLVEARGVDGAGNARLLYSTVPTAALAMVANVTPLSHAIVAMALGTEPRPVFAAGTGSSSTLSRLSTAGAAGDFLKTLIKVPMSAAKITDAAKLDLLADATFAANKAGADLLIESLAVDLTRNASGEALLHLSNKLLGTPTPEVVVDLATVRTELAKATGATPAAAIRSTLKAATASTAVLTNLGVLDELAAALNQLIAQGSTAATLKTSPLVTGYKGHNGRTLDDLATLLAGLGSQNQQFGRWTVLGCADDTVTTGACTGVQVAAPISDSTGTLVGQFTDVVSFNKAAAAGVPKWGLTGNGKKLAFAVQPVSWQARQADGTAAAESGVGVQLRLQSQVGDSTLALSKVTVQTPSGFSIPLADCGQPELCISATATSSSIAATGLLKDTLLQPEVLGWLSGADALRSARYLATYTLAGTAETRNSLLPADLPAATATAASRFPVLDGVSALAPLTAIDLRDGLNLAWATWAAANPDLRLSELRVVIRYDDYTATIARTTLGLPPSTQLALPGTTPVDGATAVAYELWLTARHPSGWQLITRYSAQLGS